MSELKVNMSKSVLIPVGEAPELNSLAQFFGCGVDFLPSSHLLGASFKSNAVWEPVVKRFRKSWLGGNLCCCLEEGG